MRLGDALRVPSQIELESDTVPPVGVRKGLPFARVGAAAVQVLPLVAGRAVDERDAHVAEGASRAEASSRILARAQGRRSPAGVAEQQHTQLGLGPHRKRQLYRAQRARHRYAREGQCGFEGVEGVGVGLEHAHGVRATQRAQQHARRRWRRRASADESVHIGQRDGRLGGGATRRGGDRLIDDELRAVVVDDLDAGVGQVEPRAVGPQRARPQQQLEDRDHRTYAVLPVGPARPAAAVKLRPEIVGGESAVDAEARVDLEGAEARRAAVLGRAEVARLHVHLAARVVVEKVLPHQLRLLVVASLAVLRGELGVGLAAIVAVLNDDRQLALSRGRRARSDKFRLEPRVVVERRVEPAVRADPFWARQRAAEGELLHVALRSAELVLWRGQRCRRLDAAWPPRRRADQRSERVGRQAAGEAG